MCAYCCGKNYLEGGVVVKFDDLQLDQRFIFQFDIDLNTVPVLVYKKLTLHTTAPVKIAFENEMYCCSSERFSVNLDEIVYMLEL
jgi:hypothetical protein